MTTLYGYAERPPEDLTARARIVDAALTQFAERGSSGTTMRSVAEAAGVSVGLVQHHFKTKDGLRQACDERAVALMHGTVAKSHPGEPIAQLADVEGLRAVYDQASPIAPYIATTALERDERGAEMFELIASSARTFFTSHWPERFPEGSERARDVAAVYTAMSLGTNVFRHRLAQAMGTSPEPVPTTTIGVAYLDAVEALADLMASPTGTRIRESVEALHQQDTTKESGP